MKKIYLNGKYSDKYSLVDDEDYDRLIKYKWYWNKGYAVRTKKCRGKTRSYQMHREILGLSPSDIKQVDHINRNRLDNYKGNLRICTQKENLHNSKARTGCASKYRGVVKRGNNWIARIKIDDIMKYLGMYFYEEDAALAYDKAARHYYGEFASLNFPNIDDYTIIGRRNPNLTSKYKGVCYQKAEQKWVAQCSVKGKRTRIGAFKTEEEAIAARIAFVESICG